MTSSLVQSFECQEYEELDKIDDVFPLLVEYPLDWCFQLKYDGIWAKIVIQEGRVQVFSKTGQLKHSMKCNTELFGDHVTVLLGEFMYGSQWAKQLDREGRFYIFDCLVIDNEDVSTLDYRRRHNLAGRVIETLGSKFELVKNFYCSKLGEIWLHIEREKNYEGVIIRKLTSTYFTKLYKLKREVEDDFICLSMYEGEGKHLGRLGGIKVGKFQGNELIEIMKVGGGFKDSERDHFWTHGKDIVGRVVLVRGKSVFDSGAFRHPQFCRVRDDKYPQSCKV